MVSFGYNTCYLIDTVWQDTEELNRVYILGVLQYLLSTSYSYTSKTFNKGRKKES